jgi:choline dehydrogenase
LQALGITSTIDNPSVGDNLSDHTFLPIIFSVQGNESFDGCLRDANEINAAIEQWVVNKTGIFANNVVNSFWLARIPSNASVFQPVTDPAPEDYYLGRLSSLLPELIPYSRLELLVQP